MKIFNFIVIFLLTNIMSYSQHSQQNLEKFSKTYYPFLQKNSFARNNSFNLLLTHNHQIQKFLVLNPEDSPLDRHTEMLSRYFLPRGKRVQPTFEIEMNNSFQQNSWQHRASEMFPGNVKTAWVKHYGSGLAPADDEAVDVAVDDSGNVYVTGTSTKSPYGADYLTIKYDSSGMELWQVRYDGGGDDIPVAIAVDAMSNIYVTGYSVGYNGMFDYITIKYNSMGIQQWLARYNGSANSSDQPSALALDAAGNVYVTGNSYGLNGKTDYATVKYDPAGNEQWVSRYNSPSNLNDEAVAISIDSSGNVYVTGGSEIEPFPSDNWDYATVKYNAEGVEQWVMRYNNATTNRWDYAKDIGIDPLGYVVVTGTSLDTVTWGDFVTIKYDSAGVLQWLARYYPDSASVEEAIALAIDDTGNVYVTGYKSGYTFDYATVKYDPNGALIWDTIYTGPDYDYDIPYDIAIDDSGNVVVTGLSYGIDGSSDYATVKYSSAGSELWSARYSYSSESYDDGVALCIDKNGIVIVTGRSWTAPTYYDFATIKYDRAGTEQWVSRYNGTGNSEDYIAGMVTDLSGNVYVAGGSNVNGEHSEFLTIKFNRDGDILWVSHYRRPGYSCAADPVFVRNDPITVDRNGYVYVTGISVYDVNDFDITTLKYDSEGILQWVQHYDGPNHKVDSPSDIAVDDSGNVYVIGWTNISSTNYDFVTIKYDSAGNEKWVARYDGPESMEDGAFAVAPDNNGNVYVTGFSYSYSSKNDYATVKYNSVGEQVWVDRYDGPASLGDGASDIAMDHAGDIIVTGYSGVEGGSMNYLTIKYDSNGNRKWCTRLLHTGNPISLAIDAENNIYVTGSGASPDEPEIARITTVKYDSSGQEVWVSQYNVPMYENERGIDLSVDYLGNVYVAASAQSPASYDDFVTLKYNSTGSEQWITTYNGPSNFFDIIEAIGLDKKGNVYVAGTSYLQTFGSEIVTVIKYEQGITTPFVVDRGWNMVSIPLIVEDYRKTALFPTAISPAWTYLQGTGYIQKDTLANGIGYWLKFGIDQVIEMTGFQYPLDTIDLAEGWNMVGSMSEPIDVNTVEFIPVEISRSNFFGYKYGYFVTDTLYPGKGYWVKVNQAAKMILSPSGTLKSISQPKVYITDEAPPPPPGEDITVRTYQLPIEFKLEQNYPNPFNPSTVIKYQLPTDGWVTLKIYNILGQEVTTLVDEMQDAGYKSIPWNAEKYPSGIYYVKMKAEGFGEVKKVVLIK